MPNIFCSKFKDFLMNSLFLTKVYSKVNKSNFSVHKNLKSYLKTNHNCCLYSVNKKCS